MTLVAPTPSRSRTLRELTVNVFHPFELMPGAFRNGEFPWHPERDGKREATIGNAAALLDFAERVHFEWQEFVLGTEEQLAARNPEVRSPRGTVSFSTLLAAQRWHTAFHYRQLQSFLRERGIAPRHALALALQSLADLDLPLEVFSAGSCLADGSALGVGSSARSTESRGSPSLQPVPLLALSFSPP